MTLTIGILSRRSRTNPDRMFGLPTAFFSECCEEATRLGMRAVVFEADDLEPDAGLLSAATYADGRWIERVTVPLPDVVYDRAPVFDPAYTPVVDLVREYLIREGIPCVNPWPLLRFAADKRKTIAYLTRYNVPVPATSVLTVETLYTGVDRFNSVFLKPVQGSNGTGIIEIRREAAAGYLIRSGTERYQIACMDHLIAWIESRLGNSVFREDVYLVQQGISADASKRRPFPRFDLRVLMQKNEQRVWSMTGIVARVSQTNVPTTNLSTGAWAEMAERVLDARYGPEKRRALIETIETACLMICERLDRDICSFGELGVDIVTDAAGRFWVLEINAKPGRSAFRRLAYIATNIPEEERRRFVQIRKRSVAMPLRYARTLCRENQRIAHIHGQTERV